MARSFTDAVGYLVRSLVRQAMGMDVGSVRAANQAAPTGTQTDEFATVLIHTAQPVGWPDPVLANAEPGDPGDVSYADDQLMDFSASVQFFRTAAGDGAGIAASDMSAFDKAARLSRRLLLPPYLQLAQTYGLGFAGASAATNVAAVVDSTYESRGQVDIDFYVVDREQIFLAAYDVARIELMVAQASGHTDTRTLEVTP
jgi:hypothetical protein